MGMTIEEKNKFIEESKEHFKEWHDMNYIPKAEYENRLKADMVAMLTELKTEFEKQCKIPNNNASAYDWNNGVYACYKVIQKKNDALKEN